MKTELSACVIQKFNGYDLLRNSLQRSEKTELVAIDIVYEPTLDVITPILCFFATQIHTAYQTFYEKSLGDNKKGVLIQQLPNNVLTATISFYNQRKK